MTRQRSPVVTLDESYERCRQLNRRHGTTYYWSTMLLPKVKRHHVHALYAFCRYADDIVDEPRANGSTGPEETERALADFGQRFFADLERGRSDDPVLKAVVHTVRAFDIDPDCFRRFLRSMTMDLTVTRYESWKDLRVYMDGSAAVIGEMMLPILEPLDPAAAPHARDLGDAFQLTNFLRDVAEDLDRGRVYLPQEDLRRYDADPSRRQVTPEWTALMRFEIGRCRRLYVSADIGIGMLPPQSARCVRTARVLYSRILDVIEEQGYDVFTQRARVPTWQKAALVARHLRRAVVRRRVVEQAAFAVAGAAMVITPLLPRGRRALAASVVVGGLAATTGAAAQRRWGTERALAAFATVATATTLIERIGTTTGLPFGRYRYTGALRPTVAGVPAAGPAGLVRHGAAGP